MSQTLIPTLREVTKEAEARSHVLMLRAGMMSPFAPGLYSLLPFGQRAIGKQEQILHEEMEKIGALEISMPSLESEGHEKIITDLMAKN